MGPTPQLVFAPFRLDRAQAQLWCGDQLIALQPRPLAVLQYLAERPGQVVPKEELLQAVWADTHVDKAALKVCVWAIRQALQDSVATPRYIETVGRKGYRFLSDAPTVAEGAGTTRAPSGLMVGRTQELAKLQDWLARAINGSRQMVFVAGEPGIGKTTLIEAFLARAQASGRVWTGRGLCIEQYGAEGAYLPIFEALGRLCRASDGQQIIDVLMQYAPLWLVQMPALLTPAMLEALQPRVAGATQERMLREMAEALEALTATRPMVLALEDLQWSDRSTIDLLAYLAQRREPARLLVLGAYRSADVVVREHPLRGMIQKLRADGSGVVMPLELLTEAEVNEYITRRFATQALPLDLSSFIWQRTDGNALFMVILVEHLIQQEIMIEDQSQWRLQVGLQAVGVPDSLHQLISQQLEGLPKYCQRVLAAASVAGIEFAVASVAAALKEEPDEIEQVCEELDWHGHFIRETGLVEWPDGTICGGYMFQHTLYKHVIYQRLTAARRVQYHRLVGERKEAAYRQRSDQVATELAIHFELGRDDRRAVQYLQQAGENAVSQGAHHEAIGCLVKGLNIMPTLPETLERRQREIAMWVALGASLHATKGPGAPAVERAYARAYELCQQGGQTPLLFPVLVGLCKYYQMSTDQQTACELGKTLLSLAQDTSNAVHLVIAHWALGQSLFYLGDLEAARLHLDQALVGYDQNQYYDLVSLYGSNPLVRCLYYATYTKWLLGYLGSFRENVQALLEQTQEGMPPFSRAVALFYATRLCITCQETQAAQGHIETLRALATEHGYTYLSVYAMILQGYLYTELGQYEVGIRQMQQGLASQQGVGTQTVRPMFLALLAMAYEKGGDAAEGLVVIAEALALVDQTSARYFEAELHRLRGMLLLQLPAPKVTEAETCFDHALAIARKQRAKSWELRVATSLSHLWLQHGKHREAHALLAPVYSWFSEGLNTADLQDAQAQLQVLSTYRD